MRGFSEVLQGFRGIEETLRRLWKAFEGIVKRFHRASGDYIQGFQGLIEKSQRGVIEGCHRGFKAFQSVLVGASEGF